MSEYYEQDEVYDDGLSDEEVFEIQEEYRRRRLIESLVGPVISTVFHILLVILLAIFITDKIKEPIAEIEVTMETIDDIELDPIVVEEPELEKVEVDETTTPVITTVKVEAEDSSDNALEDTSDEAPSTDDNMPDQAVSDIVVSPSAFASPKVFGGRSASGRASAMDKFGADKIGQDKLLKALWWLAKVQKPDGSWGTAGKPAFTGLALLTFLAHGETPTSKHFGVTVKKAMQWLVNDPINTTMSNGYPHAIKTYALAEAYAMTGVSMLADKMNKSVRVLIDGQQEGGSYNYKYNTNQERQDLSFAGWNYQALKAAYGAGCEEKGLQEAIYKAIDWLKNNSADDAKFPYSTKNNDPSTAKSKHTMRAVGVLCLQLFGEGGAGEIKDDLNDIATGDLANLNWNNPPKESLYGWYYATQAMFQAGGAKWRPWNRKFQKEISDAQHPEGYWVYPGDYHGGNVGDDITQKVYATTLCALMLTVYYRYLPSSKGAIGNKGMNNKAVKKEEKPAMEEEGIDLVE